MPEEGKVAVLTGIMVEGQGCSTLIESGILCFSFNSLKPMLLKTCLSTIPDHRRVQGRLYALEYLLLLSILAILSDPPPIASSSTLSRPGWNG